MTLPRLILISGWAHDSSAMADLRQCLENTADVSTVATGDLWSAETKIRAPSSYAQGLAKLIEKTGRPVFIAGWSLGGMIALETAADRPDLVAGLVLISSTAKFITGENWTSGVSGGALRAMTGMLKHNPRNVFADFFKNVAHTFEEKLQHIVANNGNHGGTARLRPECKTSRDYGEVALPSTPATRVSAARLGVALRRSQESTGKAGNRGAFWQRREETIALKIEKACAMNPLELSAGLEYLSKTDLRNEAAEINIPALILHGQQDVIIPVEAGLALKNLLPVSQIRVYENCGHGLPWQNPRAMAEDITGFLEACRNRKAKLARP